MRVDSCVDLDPNREEVVPIVANLRTYLCIFRKVSKKSRVTRSFSKGSPLRVNPKGARLTMR